MYDLTQVVLVTAFLSGVGGVLLAHKLWQRLICLVVTMLIVGLFFSAAFGAAKGGIAAGFYSHHIRPTGALWAIVKTNLVQQSYGQALSNVDYIVQEWPKVKPWPNSYSAADIEKELNRRQYANQAAQDTARKLADPGR